MILVFVLPWVIMRPFRENTYSPEISVISPPTNSHKLDIIQQKKAIRQQMQAQRAQLDAQVKTSYDNWICQQLWQRIRSSNAQTVHCYLPMRSEINIRPLIQQMLDARIQVVVPKTLPNRRLQHLVLANLSKVATGRHGTTFPASQQIYQGDYDLIIVPGLAFDKQKNRLGYGGGYYDNFLKNHSEAEKIGIFYPFQELPQIPVEAHDRPLDQLLYRPLRA